MMWPDFLDTDPSASSTDGKLQDVYLYFQSLFRIDQTTQLSHLDKAYSFIAYCYECVTRRLQEAASYLCNHHGSPTVWSSVGDSWYWSLTLASALTVTFSLLYFCRGRHGMDQSYNLNNDVIFIKAEYTKQESRAWVYLRNAFMTLFLASVVLSIPWEFIRLYQMEVAKRAAVSLKDMPAECLPAKMTFWNEVLAWMRSQFSWSNKDPCQAYHETIMVDPLWEVTPLIVLSSLLSRFLLKPLELGSGGVSRCLQSFMSGIPSQWQPVLLMLIVTLLVLLILVSCQYRIALTPMLHLEPGHVSREKCKRSELTHNGAGDGSKINETLAITTGNDNIVPMKAKRTYRRTRQKKIQDSSD